jgi:hypothetical protein
MFPLAYLHQVLILIVICISGTERSNDLQPVSALVFELQKHQASCEAALGPFLDGQLSGIAQLFLTAVF